MTGVVEPPLKDPTDLGSKEIRLMVVGTVRRLIDDDLPSLAAGVAFKIFLALFPAILAAAAIYGLVSTPAEVFQSVRNLSQYLPPSAAQLMEENLRTITQAERGTAGLVAVFGVLVGLFAASGAAASLIRALDRIYDIAEQRSFAVQRLIGLAISVALFLALGSLAILIVAGGTLQEFLLPDRLQIPLVTVPIAIGRFALALLVLVALFGFVYSVGPNRIPPRWQWLSPGAFLGVLAWLAVAGLFRLYTVTIGASTYDQASYGAIAGVIVLLLWLQLSMLAMLVGAELNAFLERLRADRQAARERALRPSDSPSPRKPMPPEPPVVAARPRGAAIAGAILSVLALGVLLRRALAR